MIELSNIDSLMENLVEDSAQDPPLKGKDLYEYIVGNKLNCGGNGDELCIGAGYASYSDEGMPICNFAPFVEELGKVIQDQNIQLEDS